MKPLQTLKLPRYYKKSTATELAGMNANIESPGEVPERLCVHHLDILLNSKQQLGGVGEGAARLFKTSHRNIHIFWEYDTLGIQPVWGTLHLTSCQMHGMQGMAVCELPIKYNYIRLLK